MKNVLFLCSQNKLRSPTAEAVFSDIEGFDVRSAGLDNGAAIQLSPDLVEWAQYIFVMERSHRNKLRKKFKKYLKDQRIICLDIPDDYDYMDDDLIKLLKTKMGSFFSRR